MVLDITGGRLGVAIGTLGEERACGDFTIRAEYGTEVEAGKLERDVLKMV